MREDEVNLLMDSYSELMEDVLKRAKRPLDIETVKSDIKKVLLEKACTNKHYDFINTFQSREFKSKKNIRELCLAIKKDYPQFSINAPSNTKWLNRFLEIGNFYDCLLDKHRSTFSDYINHLVEITRKYRAEDFKNLDFEMRGLIISLNRLLLETIYSETPKWIDIFYSTEFIFWDISETQFKDEIESLKIDCMEKYFYRKYSLAYSVLESVGLSDILFLDYQSIQKSLGLTDDFVIRNAKTTYRSKYIGKIYHSAIMELPILVVGETGTGKELMAKAIHRISNRRNYPFTEINCAAIPETLLESELFGYEEGSHSEAKKPKLGLFEAGDHGTIFLDELGKMAPRLQAKLLKVLEQGTINPIGSNEPIKIDVRFVAAIQPRDIIEESILPDLLYRLGYPNFIKMVTLDERLEELGSIAIDLSFKNVLRKRGMDENIKISEELHHFLLNRSYKGNYRELENILRSALINARVNSLPSGKQDLCLNEFLTGAYVNKLCIGDIDTNVQSVIEGEDYESSISLQINQEECPLSSIVEYANSIAVSIVEQRMIQTIREGREIKQVLLSEGLPAKKYQNFLKSVKTLTGKGVGEFKKIANSE